MERRIGKAFLICTLLCSVSNFIPKFFWFQEIIASFWVYLLVIHIITLPFVWCLRGAFSKKLGIASLFCLVFFSLRYSAMALMFIIPSTHEFSPQSQKISILYGNIYEKNQTPQSLDKIVGSYDPDVVALLEADSAIMVQTSFRNTYKYKIEVLDRGVWSLAMYSKFPFEGEVTKTLGEDVPPALMGAIKVNDQTVHFALLHLIPPLSDEYLTSNRYSIRRLATELRHSEEPWIVLGDFNSTPYGRIYEGFKFAARVRDGMLGKGLIATWNAEFPFFRVTIDHLFLKNKVVVENLEKVIIPGSDHWGFFTTVHVG